MINRRGPQQCKRTIRCVRVVPTEAVEPFRRQVTGNARRAGLQRSTALSSQPVPPVARPGRCLGGCRRRWQRRNAVGEALTRGVLRADGIAARDKGRRSTSSNEIVAAGRARGSPSMLVAEMAPSSQEHRGAGGVGAAMTSASRCEPPVLTTPSLRPRCRPRARPRTGKTRRRHTPRLPLARGRPWRPRGGHCPPDSSGAAPTPTIAPPFTSTIAFDLTCRQTRQARSKSALLSVGGLCVAIVHVARSRQQHRPSSPPLPPPGCVFRAGAGWRTQGPDLAERAGLLL